MAGQAGLQVERAFAHADHPVDQIGTITDLGTYSLRRLGHPEPLVLRNDPPDDIAIVPFGLRAPVQGPDRWYVLHFRARVVLPTDAAGISYVRASTNGRFVALIKLDAREYRDLGIVRMSTADFEHGAYSVEYRSREIDLDFTNHLQQKGLKDGRNVLIFDTKSLEGGRVESVKVEPTTALEYTERSPHNLRIRPVVPNRSVEVGDTFEVGYELRLLDPASPAEQVEVKASVVGEGLAIVGKADHAYPRVPSTESAAFRFRASRAGTWQIRLTADAAGEANDTKAAVEATVAHGGSAEKNPWFVLAGAGAVAVTGAYLLFGRRRRTGAQAEPGT